MALIAFVVQEFGSLDVTDGGSLFHFFTFSTFHLLYETNNLRPAAHNNLDSTGTKYAETKKFLHRTLCTEFLLLHPPQRQRVQRR